MNDASKPYSVCLWGSHPDADNDDCWMGADFATIQEARAAFDYPACYGEAHELKHWSRCLRTAVYIQIDGPDVNAVRKIDEPKINDQDDLEDWRREIAMEEGMLNGTDAYNDYMGY